MQDYGHPPKTRIELFVEGKEYHFGEHQHRHGHGGGCKHTTGENDDDDRNEASERNSMEDVLSVNRFVPSL